MSWVYVGSAAISLGSDAISSSGAKSAAKKAAQGSTDEIEFNRESRDLARGDQAPYREAGYTALDALMSMTGLGGGSGDRSSSSIAKHPNLSDSEFRTLDNFEKVNPTTGAARKGQWNDSDWTLGQGSFRGSGFQTATDPQGGVKYWSQGQWVNQPQVAADGNPFRSRAYGGAIYGRNHGGALYNINETGPENVYQGGSYTRSSLPKTIPPNDTGYVAPNIVGRQHGGALVGWADMSQRVPL